LETNPGEIPGEVSRETLISRYFPEDQRIRAYAQFLKTQGIERGLIDVKTTADYVTARAVAPLEKLKKISWHLLKVNGSLLAMKGEKAQEEMLTVPKSTLHELNLEGIELGRIVEVKKGA